MTPEAQRIAIATACGWQCVHLESYSDGSGNFDYGPRGMPPKHNLRRELPDYLSDLNAMHEAEKVLTEVQQVRFVFELLRWRWVGDCLWSDKYEGWSEELKKFPLRWYVATTTATAAQRAEAFLRVIGKWTDDFSDEDLERDRARHRSEHPPGADE